MQRKFKSKKIRVRAWFNKEVVADPNVYKLYSEFIITCESGKKCLLDRTMNRAKLITFNYYEIKQITPEKFLNGLCIAFHEILNVRLMLFIYIY